MTKQDRKLEIGTEVRIIKCAFDYKKHIGKKGKIEKFTIALEDTVACSVNIGIDTCWATKVQLVPIPTGSRRTGVPLRKGGKEKNSKS